MMAEQTHSNADVLADAGERAGVYQLLARLWAKEVDAELLAALQGGPLGDAYVAVGGHVPTSQNSSDMLEPLQLDFCRLFIGPREHIPPVQSVFQEGKFEGDAAASIRQLMEIAEIDRPPFASLPADHVANLLSTFTVLLSATLPEHDLRDDLAELTSFAFTSHVAWIVDLARIAASRAETTFYRQMLLVTERFLAEEELMFRAF